MKTKRKAIDCKMIGASQTSPGYFKYEVTIQEVDGKAHVEPAYGKDMQDAISRLVWSERAEGLTKSKKLTVVIVIAWLTSIIIPAIMASITDNPTWIIDSLAFSIVSGLIIMLVDKYFNKKWN